MFGKTSDEIKLLHTLGKCGVVDLDRHAKDGLYEGKVQVLGRKADNTHLYDYEIDYRHFKFDKENIYLDGEISSLKEIMKDALVSRESSDKCYEKLVKLGLFYGNAVKVGGSVPVYDNESNESYDSTDECFYAYTVTDEKQIEMETIGKSRKAIKSKGEER